MFGFGLPISLQSGPNRPSAGTVFGSTVTPLAPLALPELAVKIASGPSVVRSAAATEAGAGPTSKVTGLAKVGVALPTGVVVLTKPLTPSAPVPLPPLATSA